MEHVFYLFPWVCVPLGSSSTDLERTEKRTEGAEQDGFQERASAALYT